MTHTRDDDSSGKDILREHIKSIMDEAISSTVDLDDYGDELEAYADALIEGLGLHPLHVAEGHVTLAGAYRRDAR